MAISLKEELRERVTRVLREHRAESCDGVECCSDVLVKELGLSVEAHLSPSSEGYRLEKKIVGGL